MMICIGNRKIGAGQPVYIVAEISANHRQGYSETKRLIEKAAWAGADAVKVQTFTPDTMTLNTRKKHFRIRGGTLWDGRTLYDLYQEAYMPWEWQPKLKKIADHLGIDFFSSAFDPTSVDFLEAMNVPAYKVASFELVDIPLIKKIAKTKKPMILSTGMAALREVEEAVSAARGAGASQIALLKCTSAYPAPPEEMNLRAIPFLAEKFRLPIGLSDHTLGFVAALGAVALGASIVEKHFTLSRVSGGPDSTFSVEPEELRKLIFEIRTLEKSLGMPRLIHGKNEATFRIFRRSLFAVQDIRKGEFFTEANTRSIRPAAGLPPREFYQILGHKAKRAIEKGTPLDWKLVDEK